MTRVKGARALVSGQKDLAFKSYFIANVSTGLEASEDFPAAIADLKFTYGSSSSTSGCIMPSHFIIENTGKTPMEFFKESLDSLELMIRLRCWSKMAPSKLER